MKRTDINLGVAAYINDLIKEDAPNPMSKEEVRIIGETMRTAILMLNELPDKGIERNTLDNILANILAYIVSNGKSNDEAMSNHLNRIMYKAAVIIAWGTQNPIAHVLDYVKGKRKNPLKSVADTILYLNKFVN